MAKDTDRAFCVDCRVDIGVWSPALGGRAVRCAGCASRHRDDGEFVIWVVVGCLGVVLGLTYLGGGERIGLVGLGLLGAFVLAWRFGSRR